MVTFLAFKLVNGGKRGENASLVATIYYLNKPQYREACSTAAVHAYAIITVRYTAMAEFFLIGRG